MKSTAARWAIALTTLSLCSTPILLADGFIRGDADQDGEVTLIDSIYMLQFAFRGDALPCLDAADSDADGRITVSDPIYLLSYLFRSGPPPAQPFPNCGGSTFRSPPPLGCAQNRVCVYPPYKLPVLEESVVLIMDRSVFISWAGETNRVKSEISRALRDLSSDSKFAFISYHDEISSFPQENEFLHATAENVSKAISILNDLRFDGEQACPGEAILRAIDLSQQTEEPVSILYIGGGRGNCPSWADEQRYYAASIGEILDRNTKRAPINIAEIAAHPDRSYLRDIALAFQGFYFDVNETAESGY